MPKLLKCYEVDENTVGQYTGLKDKNGKGVKDENGSIEWNGNKFREEKVEVE